MCVPQALDLGSIPEPTDVRLALVAGPDPFPLFKEDAYHIGPEGLGHNPDRWASLSPPFQRLHCNPPAPHTPPWPPCLRLASMPAPFVSLFHALLAPLKSEYLSPGPQPS